MSFGPTMEVCYPTPPESPGNKIRALDVKDTSMEDVQDLDEFLDPMICDDDVSDDGSLNAMRVTSPDGAVLDALAFVVSPGQLASSASILDSPGCEIFMNESISCWKSPHPKKREYRLPNPPSLGDTLQPNLNARQVSSNPDLFRHRPVLKKSESGSSTRHYCSLRSPDRFVPKRSPSHNAVQSFRASKDLHNLSDNERLLRSASDASDVFFERRRRVTSPETNQSTRPIAIRQGQAPRRPVGGPSTVGFRTVSGLSTVERNVSLGSTWTVGGVAPHHAGVPDGRGGLVVSGTNAPLFKTTFTSAAMKAAEDADNHARRLAKALDFDQAHRVFQFSGSDTLPRRSSGIKSYHQEFGQKARWNGTEWVEEGSSTILDAPNLRDDYYCSVLAYSPTCHTMAVGLGSELYSWSENQGVELLNEGPRNASWLTSLSFSSSQGCKSILAYGRSDCTFSLLSLYDGTQPRFHFQQPCPIACISWKTTVTLRLSHSPYNNSGFAKTEELVVGDESGNIFCYIVEWPDAWEVDRTGWLGMVTHVATISVHSQQICGLAWSLDGEYLATGGNDNLCCLFESVPLFCSENEDEQMQYPSFIGAGSLLQRVSRHGVKDVVGGTEKHRWHHGAAVKAIAFCPWFSGLVATGGGSNDKCIHFFHVGSGACLATISVSAQVTSLIWSTTRREIAATFGYAQPDHPYRVAVFSWPKCEQVVAIPWEGEHRALYAIAYPGGPNESSKSREGSTTLTRTAREGCIVVAASDESVKFHEVWTASQKATGGAEGLLGGSDILEGLEGIDKEGEIIR